MSHFGATAIRLISLLLSRKEVWADPLSSKGLEKLPVSPWGAQDVVDARSCLERFFLERVPLDSSMCNLEQRGYEEKPSRASKPPKHWGISIFSNSSSCAGFLTSIRHQNLLACERQSSKPPYESEVLAPSKIRFSASLGGHQHWRGFLSDWERSSRRRLLSFLWTLELNTYDKIPKDV